ncbi:hypothetical protein F5Y16DRAFT_19797 [Xylariaceae sp. FL0255]|nr:hypothetical protein F5Y16DRAFT_19797 [Xylariaceae sp. FL0255]
MNETTRSEYLIFLADGCNLISKFAFFNDDFLASCVSILKRMLNTVPSTVTLTDVIEPIALKPRFLQTDVVGENITFTGLLRIIDTDADVPDKVIVNVVPRSGACIDGTPCLFFEASNSEGWYQTGLYGTYPSFHVWQINASFPVSSGISAFTVDYVFANGSTVTNDNAGNNFPMPDDIIVSPNRTCLADGFSTNEISATVAVLNAERYDEVIFTGYIPFLLM